MSGTSLLPPTLLARLSTRIPLATSQRPVAHARMEDGSVWKREVEVLVTLATCVDG